MKCLSLIQPWAWLWCAGIKKNETRSWPMSYRGELHVHASKSYSDEGARLWETLGPAIGESGKEIIPFEDLPRGCIIGKVNIVKCTLMTESIVEFMKTTHQFEMSLGDWKPGRFAILADSPVMFDQPIDAKGQLGLWDYDPVEASRKSVFSRFIKESGRAGRRRIAAAIARTRAAQRQLPLPARPAPPVFDPLQPVKRKFEL